jgi:ketosteroid isomerase-like protein
MSLDRAQVTAFIENYHRTWQTWDVDGFVELFSDDAVYVDHPIEKIAVGQEAVADFLRNEESEQGTATVRMGTPIIDGNRVAVEYWVTKTNGDEEATLTGCLMAQLDPTDGRCKRIHEYWFDIEGHPSPYAGWGE